MRKGLLVGLVFVFCTVYAVAQFDYHKLEVGGGWNYLHFDTARSGQARNYSENSASGLFIDGTFYARHWVGLTADFEFNQKSFAQGTLTGPGGPAIDSNLLGLMFGPRFKAHYSKVEPFGHGLFGFSRVSVKPGVGAAGVFPNSSDTAFAMKFGGGVDVGVAKHFAARVGEFNYYLTRFGTSDCLLGPRFNCGINGKGTQNNFTFSAGIVIR